MLKLLLDEHISPAVAGGLHRRDKTIPVFDLPTWGDGRFLGMADNLLLMETAADGLTLVTYDRRTIPPLLKTWVETGQNHGGVIFVDEKSISPSDIGGLIQALQRLFLESSRWDWVNRVCFLRR